MTHPNVAQIYGLEEHDGTVALVMELVEGEVLGDRVKRSAAPRSAESGSNGHPLEGALTIARQIADALEAAHEIRRCDRCRAYRG